MKRALVAAICMMLLAGCPPSDPRPKPPMTMDGRRRNYSVSVVSTCVIVLTRNDAQFVLADGTTVQVHSSNYGLTVWSPDVSLRIAEKR